MFRFGLRVIAGAWANWSRCIALAEIRFRRAGPFGPAWAPPNRNGVRGVLVDVMRHSDIRLRAALIAFLVWIASAYPAAQPKSLFSFHSNAWLNLHHYVRVNGRGAPGPGGLTPAQQKDWAEGVEFYKPYAVRDVLRDDGMVAIASVRSVASPSTITSPSPRLIRATAGTPGWRWFFTKRRTHCSRQ